MSRLVSPTCRLVAGAVAAFVLAACADSTSAPNDGQLSPTSPDRNVGEFNVTRHEFRTKDFYAKPGGGKPQSTGILYHGGTVITSPATKVVSIYWGDPGYQGLPVGTGSGSQDGTLIGSFLRGLGGSPYFNINTTYYDANNVRVQNAVTYTSYWNTTGSHAGPSASPTDADMINLIRDGISSGKIAYDATTVYAIFTGNGINLGGGFGSRYCAYHTHGSLADGRVFYYAAMPYNQQYPSGCTSGYTSPNADVAANSEVNTLAHEIEETTTDPMGTAWYDRRGYENADKCAWTWGTTSTASNGGVYNMTIGGIRYLVQRNWVNAGSGGCAVSF